MKVGPFFALRSPTPTLLGKINSSPTTASLWAVTSRWALHTPLVPGPPHWSQNFLFFRRRRKKPRVLFLRLPAFSASRRSHRCRARTSHPCVSHGLGFREAEGPPYDHHTFGIGVADWLPRPALRPPLPRWDCTAPLCQYPPSMVPAACLALAPPLWRPVLGAPWRGAPVQRIETRFAIFVVAPFSPVEIGNKDV